MSTIDDERIMANFSLLIDQDKKKKEQQKRNDIEIKKREELIKNSEPSVEIREYIYEIINNVDIGVENNLFMCAPSLIEKGNLEGFCWQTSEFLGTLFPKNSYICRGNLQFYTGGKYAHSWLEFILDNKCYVFDPCLNYLCEKDIYESVFAVTIYSKIRTELASQELIQLLRKSKERIFIQGSNNIEDVFYRTNTSVSGECTSNKILSLKLQYYSLG